MRDRLIFGPRRNPLLMVVPNKKAGRNSEGGLPAWATGLTRMIGPGDVVVWVDWKNPRWGTVIAARGKATRAKFYPVYRMKPDGRRELLRRVLRDELMSSYIMANPGDPQYKRQLALARKERAALERKQRAHHRDLERRWAKIEKAWAGRNPAEPTDWIEEVLSNDEASSDAELVRLFVTEGGLSPKRAAQWVANRQKYLAGGGVVTLPSGKKVMLSEYMKARHNPEDGAADLWRRSFSREFATHGLGGLKADFKEIFRRAETYRRRGVLPGEAARLIHAVLTAKPSTASRLPRYLPHPNPGTDMGSIARTPDFQKGLKLYRQIHGCDPKSIKRTIMRLGPNDNKVTGRVVLVSMGKAPADSYEPPKGSRKEGRIWVHPYDNKPEKVVTVDGKTIITMPGTHAVKAGPDGEAWIHG